MKQLILSFFVLLMATNVSARDYTFLSVGLKEGHNPSNPTGPVTYYTLAAQLKPVDGGDAVVSDLSGMNVYYGVGQIGKNSIFYPVAKEPIKSGKYLKVQYNVLYGDYYLLKDVQVDGSATEKKDIVFCVQHPSVNGGKLACGSKPPISELYEPTNLLKLKNPVYEINLNRNIRFVSSTPNAAGKVDLILDVDFYGEGIGLTEYDAVFSQSWILPFRLSFSREGQTKGASY